MPVAVNTPARSGQLRQIKCRESIMRKIIVGVILLMAAQGVALAQGSTDRKGWGYAFGGVGGASGSGSTAFFSAGGGGEGLVFKGLGLGAEIGYVAPFRDPGNGIGIVSPNISYHFSRESKLVPFVTGGYSLAFRNSANSSGGNFGGGVQYWMKDRVALRVEFRDHVFSSDSPHLFQFRVGLSFR
jgi:opacity protein-like surface antigen